MPDFTEYVILEDVSEDDIVSEVVDPADSETENVVQNVITLEDLAVLLSDLQTNAEAQTLAEVDQQSDLISRLDVLHQDCLLLALLLLLVFARQCLHSARNLLSNSWKVVK